MRCIEMVICYCTALDLDRLTLTWDVLKLIYIVIAKVRLNRLTLTWDVLKYSFSFASASDFAININMRCIEMNILTN